MKLRIAIILCATGAGLLAQSSTLPAVIPPGFVAIQPIERTDIPVVGLPGQPSIYLPIPWQDSRVKILGNAAYPYPLDPAIKLAGTPTWGPRSNPARGRLLNLSCRGLVGPGDQVLVGGLIVSDGDRIVMIRAIGPTLSAFGVSRVLNKPRLELFDSSGASLAVAIAWSLTNLDTRTELSAAARDVGAFPLLADSDDQVLLVFLKKGSYTCVVSSPDGSTGTVLLEAYEVPSKAGP